MHNSDDMERADTAVLMPLACNFIVKPLPVQHHSRILSLVLIMYNQSEIVERFVKTVVHSLQQWLAHQFEIILVDYHSTDNSCAVVKRFLHTMPSLYLMNSIHDESMAESLFRAWQLSRTRLCSVMEVGDYGAIHALSSMMAEMQGKNIDSKAQEQPPDMVVGSRTAPKTGVFSTLRRSAMVAVIHWIGRIIMPHLFKNVGNPLSNCMLLKREILCTYAISIYGDAILPNLLTQLDIKHVVDMRYASTAEDVLSTIPFRLGAVISALGKVYITHKMGAINRA